VATLEQFWAEAGIPPRELPRQRFNRRRYLPLLNFLDVRPPAAHSRILDIGAGIGNLCVAMRARYGGTFHYADFALPAPGLQEILRRHGVEHFFAVNLAAPTPFAELEGGYDWVLMTEVLEHLLVNPVELFRSIAGLLNREGRLVLTTPNQARITNRARLLLGRSIREPHAFPSDGRPLFGHVAEYTLEDLRSLLASAGLAVERTAVIQNLPSMTPSTARRALVRLLNTAPARALALGDDILIDARRVSE
jgi:2-polyprenyl-3-methyl-5-hydroxy-6-metoxy-1,4-benzoquinol methylase